MRLKSCCCSIMSNTFLYCKVFSSNWLTSIVWKRMQLRQSRGLELGWLRTHEVYRRVRFVDDLMTAKNSDTICSFGVVGEL